MDPADLMHGADEPVPENLVAAKVQPADSVQQDEAVESQSLFGRIRTFLSDVILRWRVAHTKVNQNEQCPACGHRTGRIEFESKSARLWHHCLICRARWSESPILNPTEWHR